MPDYRYVVARPRRKDDKNPPLYVQMAVPRGLQGAKFIGKPLFCQSLKTREWSIAEIRKGPIVSRWKTAILRARGQLERSDPYALPSELLIALKSRGATDPDEKDDLRMDALKALGDSPSEQMGYMFSELERTTAPSLAPAPSREELEILDIVSGSRTPLMGPHFDRWLATFAATDERTQASRKQSVMQFLAWLRAQGLPEIIEPVRKSLAARYAVHLVQEKGYRRATAKKLLGGLGLYWKALDQFELYSGPNPWPDILQHGDVKPLLEARKNAGDDTGQREAFTDSELETLFSQAPRSVLDAMAIVYLSGLRTGELYSLQVKDCRNGFFHICRGELVQADGKTVKKKSVKNANAVRLVPIHRELRPIVARLTAGRKPDDRLFIEATRDIVNRVGKSHSDEVNEYRQRVLPQNRTLTFYSFRHTAESAMRSAGVDLDTIHLVCGQECSGMAGKVYANYKRIFNAREPNKQDLDKLRGLMLPAIESIDIPPKVLAAIRS